MKCFLRIGGDTLEEVEVCCNLAEAKRRYYRGAVQLLQYDQRIEATIHIADRIEDVVEYPDYVLSLGPRGGLKCERA